MIFLIYLHSLQVKVHLKKQEILFYQVYSNCCLYNELIFLIYLHSRQVINHSIIQLVLLYQVFFILSHFIRYSFHKWSLYAWKRHYVSCIFLSFQIWYYLWFKWFTLYSFIIHSLSKSQKSNIFSFKTVDYDNSIIVIVLLYKTYPHITYY